jgi:hypothetical protein
VSKDRGKTWRAVNFDPLLDVAKIWVDPEFSDVVYAVANLGFFKSTDGGYHWTKSGTGLPYNQPRDGDYYYDNATKEFVMYLVEQTHYAPDGKTVKASGGVFKSVDRGETWISITGNLMVDMTQIHQKLASDSYYRAIGYWFGMSPADARKAYPEMPTSTFTVFNRVVASKTRKDTIFLGHNCKHDYAFGPGDIWRTTDGGAAWTVVGRNGIYWVNQIDGAYWRSRGNKLGMNMRYAHLQNQMRGNDVDAGLRMLASKPDGDLVAIHEQQTLRSTDHGESWWQIDDDETHPGSGRWVGRGGRYRYRYRYRYRFWYCPVVLLCRKSACEPWGCKNTTTQHKHYTV